MKFYYHLFLLVLFIFYSKIGLTQNDAVQLVQFSHSSGFYGSNFTLKLTTPSPNTRFKYTIDGSEPAQSGTAQWATDSVSIAINPDAVAGRGKTPGFVVRAALQRADGKFETSITRTFIFHYKIKDQQMPGSPWPGTFVNHQLLDYAMAADIANKAPDSFQLIDALKQIPSISIVTDLSNLFNTQTGIYVNAEKKGREWERPCSVELIEPNGETGFQINAGIRVRGGNSAKNKNNPKHAFRLFFRGEYGATKLNFPLFGDQGAQEFDCIDLRCEQNYSWSMDGSPHNTLLKDIFSRDLQGQMGQPHKRGKQYHLYLNGMYWGIYQTDERAEASFAESYFGGDKEDYDVVKVNTQPWPYYIETTDGNLDAWEQLWKFCKTGFASNANYFNLEGKDAYGIPKPNSRNYVDLDNLIDYMLIIFYTGNFDAPVSGWYSNDMPNNFYAIFNRKNTNLGFKFLAHDSEHSLFVESVYGFKGINENRVNLGSTGSMSITSLSMFNPQWLHHKLTSNAEYKIRFANRAYLHLTGKGVLTPEQTDALFRQRASEIDVAVIAESARWGDAQTTSSRNKTNHWLPAVNTMYNNYFPKRTAIVIGQLKSEGLWLTGNAPQLFSDTVEISQSKLDFEGTVEIKFENPNNEGTIYYTLDGSNPRNIGGSMNPKALPIANGARIQLGETTLIKAQIKYSTGWGPVTETLVRNNQNNFANFKVTELHYNPQDIFIAGDTISGKDLEFIEFKNTGTSVIDLTGLFFVSGIEFSFPDNYLLEPGAFFVAASKPNKFQEKHGFYPEGNFKKNFSNSGELVQLANAQGVIVLAFEYQDKAPWPKEADGDGYTLTAVEANPTGNPADYTYWKASSQIDGSPGYDDRPTSVERINQLVLKPMLYPNPSNGPITLHANGFEHKAEVTILDLSGKTVAKTTLSNGETRHLNEFNLKQGMYLAKIEFEGTVHVQKISLIMK
jgi:hypothetical protein